MKKSISIISILLATAALAACGGGSSSDKTTTGNDGSNSGSGGGGNTSTSFTIDDVSRDPVVVTDANVQAVSRGVIVGAKFYTGDDSEFLFEQPQKQGAGFQKAANRDDLSSIFCPEGGTAMRTIDFSESKDTIEIVMEDCVHTGWTYNGYHRTVDTLNSSEDTIFSVVDVDIAIVNGDMRERIWFHQECDTVEFECVLSEYVDTDEGEFIVEEFESDSASDFDYEYIVYSDLGYVAASAEGLTVCDNGNFSSGSIVIWDEVGEELFSITFSSCDSYTLTIDGVATVFDF